MSRNYPNSWNRYVHYRAQKSKPLVPILSQINSVHVPIKLLVTHCTFILPSTLISSKSSLSFRFHHQNSVCPFTLPIYATCTTHLLFLLVIISVTFTNRHLPLVLPVCSIPETTCTCHIHCATVSKLPLTMTTQSVDRTARVPEFVVHILKFGVLEVVHPVVRL